MRGVLENNINHIPESSPNSLSYWVKMILCHMKSIVVASILVYEVAVTSVYEIIITRCAKSGVVLLVKRLKLAINHVCG